MRKKQAIEENINLFNQLNDAKAQIELLKRELEATKNEIASLTKKAEEETKSSKSVENVDEKKVSVPLAELERKVEKNEISLPEDIDYASRVIGDIVLESARLSNMLTADGETKYMELVNLLLGKSEVAKSEILSVTKETVSIEEKKEKMNGIKFNAFEYFNSVMAQR